VTNPVINSCACTVVCLMWLYSIRRGLGSSEDRGHWSTGGAGTVITASNGQAHLGSSVQPVQQCHAEGCVIGIAQVWEGVRACVCVCVCACVYVCVRAEISCLMLLGAAERAFCILRWSTHKELDFDSGEGLAARLSVAGVVLRVFTCPK